MTPGPPAKLSLTGPASYSAVRKPDKTGDEGETQLQILEEINPL